MSILHIVPGLGDVANGMVVVARLFAKEQGDAAVVDLNDVDRGKIAAADEVWVHGMWLPKEWRACWHTFKAGKKLVRMTHGSLSPIYLTRQSPWKKRLVSPIERYFLRKADKVVATCNAEVEWIWSYEPRLKDIEIVDLKRFFNLDLVNLVNPVKKDLHLLYLGRVHPLKGLDYLLSAIRQLDPNLKCENEETGQTYFFISQSSSLQLKAVSNAFDEEKERIWDWCDVLVLPTLSENFGLVIAEALERGKRVITTDGAPAWDDGNNYGGRLIYLKGYRVDSPAKRIELLRDAIKTLIP